MSLKYVDRPQPTAGGLTVRELHCDLESLRVRFDPASKPATLYRQKIAAEAAKRRR